MDIDSLIAQALILVKGNQAELARRLGRTETTVSRWVTKRNGIDYESCLRLAKITGLPARVVLEAAGLDPSLLPLADSEALTPIQRDVLTRAIRIQAAVDAAEGVPDGFVETYLRTVLDNTESEITAAIELVRQQKQLATTPTPSPVADTRRRRVTKPPEEFGRDNSDLSYQRK